MEKELLKLKETLKGHVGSYDNLAKNIPNVSYLVLEAMENKIEKIEKEIELLENK